MFLLFASETAGDHGAAAAHHTPIIVERINSLIGGPLHRFQMKYTYPRWKTFFEYFGTTPEAVFGGPYTPENAVPWYTIMFIIACILSVTVIWILKGRLSEEEPGGGQQTLEATILAIRGLLVDVVGPHGIKYFPVVATFAVLILISNLMGFFPLFMAPTAATSVTFALGLTSFGYYNYIGIKENGLLGHLKHWTGPLLWLAPLIFVIELVGNFVRPMSLGLRLFGNMFADEQVASTIAGLAPPITQWIVPVPLMALALFVAVIQSFVFTLLSMVYLSEVSHPPHAEHEHDGAAVHAEANVVVPA